MEEKKYKKEHPILNGSTKIIVIISAIFLGVIGLILVGGLIYLTINNSIIKWRIEYILGVINILSIGNLGYVLHKFMDTRDTETKQHQKRKLFEVKTRRKLDKLQYKLEKIKIKKNF